MPENTHNVLTQGLGDFSDATRLNTVLNGVTNSLQAIMNEDLILVCTPATLGSSAAAVNTAIAGDGFERAVVVELEDTAGNTILHTGDFTVAASEVTAGDGTASIKDAAIVVSLVNGVGSITMVYIGTWANADTATLTVTGGTVAGITVANKTSVDTLIA